MKRLLFAVAAIAAMSGPARSETLLDKLKPQIGKVVLVSAAGQFVQVTLKSVGDDHFCVDPAEGADACYAARAILVVVLRGGDVHPVAITLDLPPGERLVGEAL